MQLSFLEILKSPNPYSILIWFSYLHNYYLDSLSFYDMKLGTYSYVHFSIFLFVVKLISRATTTSNDNIRQVAWHAFSQFRKSILWNSVPFVNQSNNNFPQFSWLDVSLSHRAPKFIPKIVTRYATIQGNLVLIQNLPVHSTCNVLIQNDQLALSSCTEGTPYMH